MFDFDANVVVWISHPLITATIPPERTSAIIVADDQVLDDVATFKTILYLWETSRLFGESKKLCGSFAYDWILGNARSAVADMTIHWYLSVIELLEAQSGRWADPYNDNDWFLYNLTIGEPTMTTCGMIESLTNRIVFETLKVRCR